MAAIGLLLVGFGALTAWSGLDRVLVFDVLRSIIGAQPKARTAEGATHTSSAVQTASFVTGGGAGDQQQGTLE